MWRNTLLSDRKFLVQVAVCVQEVGVVKFLYSEALQIWRIFIDRGGLVILTGGLISSSRLSIAMASLSIYQLSP